MGTANKKVYTKGVEDVERVLEHLVDIEKKERRTNWLRDYSNRRKQPKPKENVNENNRES